MASRRCTTSQSSRWRTSASLTLTLTLTLALALTLTTLTLNSNPNQVENKRQYAAQHGFELVVAQNLQHGRTARWDKVMLLRQLLRKYEWLHWVDLDTLFMNLKRNPNEFLDPAFDLHVAKVNP